MQHPFNCPHCFTEKVAFKFMGYVKIKDTNMATKSAHTTFWACANCHNGLCATVETERLEYPCKANDAANYNFTVLKTYPEVKASQAPEHTPENIAKIYIQGKNSFNRKEFDAATTMMRKALEMAVKPLIPDPKIKKLFNKIEFLKNNGLIPVSMVEWAHAIRDIGNDGAHDTVSKKDAHDIVYFTEMFLTYIYTLPTKIAKWRENVSESAE